MTDLREEIAVIVATALPIRAADQAPAVADRILSLLARAGWQRVGQGEIPETVYRAVERVLDEHSAWIARPNDDVTKAVALAAGIAWSLHSPVGPGEVVVPREPTAAMLEAVVGDYGPPADSWRDPHLKKIRAMIWTAMLTAARPSPTGDSND